MIREIFYELLKEAVLGEIVVDGDSFLVGFNSIVTRNNKEYKLFNEINNINLIINNEEEFFELLERYLLLENELNRKCISFVSRDSSTKIKFLIMNLFTNMSLEEFLHPCDMLRRKIAFLEYNTFDYLDEEELLVLDDVLDNANINIRRSTQSVMMETPYKVSVELVKLINGQTIKIPVADISYGIVDEFGEKVCYVYSVMKPKNKKDTSLEQEKFAKKVNREMYKLNDGVMAQESEEYVEYRNTHEGDYPENISDVTHSFVLASTVFVTLLQKEEISKLKLVPYLPVRYSAR